MKTLTTLIFSLLALASLTGCENRSQNPTGELFVMTRPEGAVVEVNGEVLGTTPLQNSNVPAGPLKILLRKGGYETRRLSLNLQPGTRAVREVNLDPVQGLVLIRSTPPDAAVSIGEVIKGNTPLALHTIELGTHRARLVKSGYNDKEIEFTVDNRIPKVLDVDLISNSGSLVVHTEPTGAILYVDGRNEGITPVSIDRIEKGEREVTLEMPGFESVRRTVLVEADTPARIDITLTPLPGQLDVVTVPDGGRVYINGQFRGEAPLTLEKISPGVYSIRVDKRGYAADTRTVRIERGRGEVEEFELVRNSGTLQIVTRPAGVRVNVDGEFMGVTRAPEGRTDVMSLPLQIDMLSQGSHTLQLVREGYSFENKRFFITKDKVTTLEETLSRKFIPDVLVRFGQGQDEAIEAVLIRRHWNGELELEIRKGVYRTFEKDEYISVEPLKEREEIEEPEAPEAESEEPAP